MSEPQVDETESTSDSVSTNLPTYFSYRLTISHEHVAQVYDICRVYSNDFCFVLHQADEAEKAPHYHFVFMSMPKKIVANMQKAFKDKYNGKGNKFHAGLSRDNDVIEALSYFSHDPVAYRYYPDSWADRIKAAPPWIPNGPSRSTDRRPREKLGDPILTYTNVVKQAVLYRGANNMDTSSLTNVISRMVNQGGWLPSRDLLLNGVPRDLHELFGARIHKRKWDPDWMYPHDRSEEKQKWLDRPDTRARIYPDPCLIQRLEDN